MKHILKDDIAPNYLPEWVAQEKEVLEGTDHKGKWKHFGDNGKNVRKKLRSKLLKEQGYICAYCNQNIHSTYRKKDLDVKYMSIEHIKPKSEFKDKIFDYYNLVGVCRSQKGRKNYIEDHCDVCKDDTQLPEELDPTKDYFERNVKCETSGILYSTKNVIDNAIIHTLKLNCKHLQKDRKKIIKSIEYKLALLLKEPDTDYDTFTKKYCEDELALYAEKEGDYYKAYSGTIILYLKDQLKDFQ